MDALNLELLSSNIIYILSNIFIQLLILYVYRCKIRNIIRYVRYERTFSIGINRERRLIGFERGNSSVEKRYPPLLSSDHFIFRLLENEVNTRSWHDERINSERSE